jgi:hypothetical protein
VGQEGQRGDKEEGWGQAEAGLTLCRRGVGVLGLFRVWRRILGLFPRLIGVVTLEVILEGGSDCLAGCIPYFVVQVVRQIDGYGWHQPDNVT